MTQGLPVGFIAMWAMIGVVAAVIVVRLRDGDFGLRIGGALFVLGGVALAAMCMAVRHETRVFGEVDGVLRNGTAVGGRGTAALVVVSAHGKVRVPRFQDAVPR